MRLKPLDLVVTAVIAALNVTLVLFPIHASVIRIILALPLVLVLPGYTLSEVLFRKRSLDASERLLFSLGLSLAIDILGGLFLNILPVGLQAASWAALLGMLTLIFSLLVAYLRRGVPVGGVQLSRVRLAIYPGIVFALAVAVAIVAVVYAAYGAAHQPSPGFTQLWMLPEVSAGKSCAVRLGVQSFESAFVTYRLAMTANGDSVATWSSLSLAPQEEWVHLVPITPSASDNIYVDVRLYQADKPVTVYREVHLTFSNVRTDKIGETRQCGTPTNPTTALASAYDDLIYDVPANIKTTMALTSIQQSGRSITGHFTAGAGLPRSGSFKGMVASAQSIQFTVADTTGRAVLSFDGALHSDGTLAGTFCTLDQAGQCGGNYGLWSVTPKST